MTTDTLSEDATCLVNMAGVGRYNVLLDENEGTNPHNIAKLSSTAQVSRYWRPREVMRGSDHAFNEVDQLKKLYTPELAEQVYQHVKLDYDIFHISKPSWIPHATGEWADSVDYKECYYKQHM